MKVEQWNNGEVEKWFSRFSIAPLPHFSVFTFLLEKKFL